MVRIRLRRVGRKKAPMYRIVVADSRSPRDGKFIEELGTYHPLQKGNNFTLDLERAKRLAALLHDAIADVDRLGGIKEQWRAPLARVRLIDYRDGAYLVEPADEEHLVH